MTDDTRKPALLFNYAEKECTERGNTTDDYAEIK